MNLKRWANKTPKEALPIELDQAEDVAQLPNPRRRSREDMEEASLQNNEIELDILDIHTSGRPKRSCVTRRSKRQRQTAAKDLLAFQAHQINIQAVEDFNLISTERSPYGDRGSNIFAPASPGDIDQDVATDLVSVVQESAPVLPSSANKIPPSFADIKMPSQLTEPKEQQRESRPKTRRFNKVLIVTQKSTLFNFGVTTVKATEAVQQIDEPIESQGSNNATQSVYPVVHRVESVSPDRGCLPPTAESPSELQHDSHSDSNDAVPPPRKSARLMATIECEREITTEKATPEEALDPLDIELLEALKHGKVPYGLRLKWRRRFMNTNVLPSGGSISGILLPDDIRHQIGQPGKIRFSCMKMKCKGSAELVIGGPMARQSVIAIKCTKCNNIISTTSKRIDNYRYACDVKMAYISLCEDDGYKGYKSYANAYGISSMSEPSMYRYHRIVYNKHDEFHHTMRQNAHETVIDFLKRQGIKPREEDGKYDITVSMDGSYPKRGYHSRFCATFAFESTTGTCIDCIVSEQCVDRKCQPGKKKKSS